MRTSASRRYENARHISRKIQIIFSTGSLFARYSSEDIATFSAMPHRAVRYGCLAIREPRSLAARYSICLLHYQRTRPRPSPLAAECRPRCWLRSAAV